MPQRSVATNFTFEQQRQEINLLAGDFWTQKGIVDGAASTYLKHDGSNDFTGQTLAVPNAFTINANSGSGTVTISGNLDVTGTTTTVSSANLEVTDKNILIAKGSTSDSQADGAGITIDSGTDITFNFVDAKDALVSSIGLEGTTFLKAPYGQFTGNGTPSTGQGIEINAPDANTGQIISYDRPNTAYKELRVKGSSVKMYGGTSNALTGTFNSTGLYMESGKTIGIGDSSGSQSLIIKDADPRILLTETTNNSNCYLDYAAGGILEISVDDNNVDASSKFQVRIDGATAGLTLDSTGLGVGTDSPTNALDVQGGTTNTAIVARSTDAKAAISFVDNTTTGVGSCAVGAEGDDLFLTSGSGGAERIRIESDGKIKLITNETTDYFQYGNNPRLWLKCPSGINGLRIDASTTPLEIKTSNNDGKSISVDSNFNLNINADYSLAASGYDSSGKIFLNATRHNGTTTATAFQTSIQAVATSNANNTGYLGFGSSATPDDLVIKTDGTVGIGTVAPRCKAEVYDSSVSAVFNATDLSTWRVLQVRNNIETNIGTAAGISFGGDGGSDTESAGICGISQNSTGGIVDLAFITSNGNASKEQLRIDRDGKLVSSVGSEVSHQSGGDKLVYADLQQSAIADSTNDYHTLKSWRADKGGSFTLEVSMMNNAGTYYWAWIVYNATQGIRINQNGSGGDSNNLRFNDGLASGQSTNVHAFRRFSITCGSTLGSVKTGDKIELRMASSDINGNLVTGNGQNLRAQGLKIFSTTGNPGTGAVNGAGYNAAMNTRNCCYWWLDRNGDYNGFNSQTESTHIPFNRLVESANFSGNDHNAGVVTIQQDGVYALNASAYSVGSAFTQGWWIVDGVRHNGCDIVLPSTTAIMSMSGFMYLTAGQTVGFHPHYSGSTSITIKDNTYHTYFRGCLINATNATRDSYA